MALTQPTEISFQRTINFHKKDTFNLLLLPSIMLQPKQFWSYQKHYHDDLGFFCKIELQLEQKAKLPIKFRLGEVQYVERMEGKY